MLYFAVVLKSKVLSPAPSCFVFLLRVTESCGHDGGEFFEHPPPTQPIFVKTHIFGYLALQIMPLNN